MSLLSVVVNYKTDDLLYKFLESYTKYVSTPNNYLVVVDILGDGSNFNRIANLNNLYNCRWWFPENNLGYARSVNEVIANYRDQHITNIAIFNADTAFVDSNCVPSCLDLLDSNDDIAVVGPMQYTSTGKITNAGIVGTNSRPYHAGWMQRNLDDYRTLYDCVSVMGAAYFIKASVWWELTDDPDYQIVAPGALGAFLPTDLYYEETWCSYFARHRGYRVVYNGEAEMIHEHDSSPNPFKDQKIKEAREYFRQACDTLGIEHD